MTRLTEIIRSSHTRFVLKSPLLAKQKPHQFPGGQVRGLRSGRFSGEMRPAYDKLNNDAARRKFDVVMAWSSFRKATRSFQ